MAHSRYSLNGYFHPMTKGDLVCQKLWAQAWGSDTAVEQLDAHVGGRSRRDVGRRALRPTSDPVGHRNKGERTTSKLRQLLVITERMGTARGHGISPRGLPALASKTGSHVKEHFQISESCFITQTTEVSTGRGQTEVQQGLKDTRLLDKV